MRENPKEDLTGKTFGRLTVLCYKGRNKNGANLWECECSCGNRKIIEGPSLKRGNTKSCGCYAKEAAKENGKHNLIDISGEMFGRLTVIKYIGESKWLCKCDCGNESVVVGDSLKNGATRSCGCLHKERTSESRLIDLTGQTFGKLTVIVKASKQGDKRVMWECVCECGNKTIVSGNSLSSGKTQSCGCLQKERTSEASFIDLKGMTFGRLLVLEKDNSKTSKRRIYWLCQCDCGNIVSVMGSSLGKHTFSCGCYAKDRASEARLIEMQGKRFGKLIVLERADNYITPSGNVFSQWLCRCDCGETTVVNGTSLRRGLTKSCGCLSESWIASEVKSYLTETFNGIPEYKAFINPETNRYLYYDVYVPDNIYVEIHGKQHYEFIKHWHKDMDGFRYSQHKDLMKKQYAEENGIYIEIDLRKIKTIKDAISYIENIINKL